MGCFDYSGACGSSSAGKLLLGLFLAALAVFLVVIFFFPVQPVGIQAQLTDSSGGTIADGSPVLFNAVLNNTNPAAITYVPASGTFIINKSGTYLVTWWVSVDGAEAATYVRFSAVVNGGMGIPADTPSVTDQLNGTALVTVTSTPAAISIVNQTGFTAFIGATPEQANITITRI